MAFSKSFKANQAMPRFSVRVFKPGITQEPECSR